MIVMEITGAINYRSYCHHDLIKPGFTNLFINSEPMMSLLLLAHYSI